MMMPSMVRKVRSLCESMARIDMRKASTPRSSHSNAPRRIPIAGRRDAAARAPGRRVSPTMRPSLISMMRWASAATVASWVTMMIVWPSPCSSLSSAMRSAPLFESSAPVGSSARMTSPPFISARATLTRCCWPPDRAPGRLRSRSPRPSRVNRSLARRVRVPPSTPA